MRVCVNWGQCSILQVGKIGGGSHGGGVSGGGVECGGFVVGFHGWGGSLRGVTLKGGNGGGLINGGPMGGSRGWDPILGGVLRGGPMGEGVKGGEVCRGMGIPHHWGGGAGMEVPQWGGLI